MIQIKWILRRSCSLSRTLVFTYPSSMQRRSYRGKILGWKCFLMILVNVVCIAIITSLIHILRSLWFWFHLFFFLNSMDKNGTMTIDRNEWSNYPLLQPKENNIPEITLYWKHSTVRRVGGRGLWTSYPPSREQFYFTLIWVHSVSTDKIPESSKLWMGMLILLHRLTLWMDVRHQLSLISV